ncbi:MAG: hypothetical protein ACMG6E_06115 [Candidatus Roizmanbacteria bacterium]
MEYPKPERLSSKAAKVRGIRHGYGGDRRARSRILFDGRQTEIESTDHPFARAKFGSSEIIKLSPREVAEWLELFKSGDKGAR